MISLGQASNYSSGRALGQLFARGSEADSVALRTALAEKYRARPELVALYHSGRSALTVALKAVGEKGNKVIIPGLTCIAVVRAVKAAGMEPVFADITEENLEYDYDSIDKIAKVCYNGIIVVQNTLGLTWDISKIEQIAKKYHLAIVEDLAHSAGRFYADGREVGTVGQAVALSFGKGKAIDTINGGAVIIRQDQDDNLIRDNGSAQGGASTRQADPTRDNDSAREGDPVQNTLAQPTRLPTFSERARDRWYPILAGLCRGLWRVKLGQVMMMLFVKMGWVKRSADTELDTDVRLTDWQARLALRQLKELPRTPLREFKLVRQREKLLAELDRVGYNFHEIWYDTPVSPARYQTEANFPTAKCPTTVRISQQIINIPTWYPASKLAKARAIIAKYEIGGKDDAE